LSAVFIIVLPSKSTTNKESTNSREVLVILVNMELASFWEAEVKPEMLRRHRSLPHSTLVGAKFPRFGAVKADGVAIRSLRVVRINSFNAAREVPSHGREGFALSSISPPKRRRNGFEHVHEQRNSPSFATQHASEPCYPRYGDRGRFFSRAVSRGRFDGNDKLPWMPVRIKT